jgi:membrane associated rhomboid family serine protease
MMVVLQVVFDYFPPMVSSTAHLSGLAIGFAIGLPFALAGSREEKGAGVETPGALDGRRYDESHPRIAP